MLKISNGTAWESPVTTLYSERIASISSLFAMQESEGPALLLLRTHALCKHWVALS